MTTPAQQIANQANAQHSTGPITPDGKARSAANSRVHGLCAQDILVGSEEQPEFDRMLIGYHIELDPQGEIEQTLFDELVGAAWQLRRIRRMETEACAGPDTFAALLDDEVLQKKLDRLARHHTRLERTFHRCLKELKKLGNERLDHEATLIQIELQRGRSAAPPRISERTQFPDLEDVCRPMSREELAEIERDLDRMAPNMAELLRKRDRQAA